jgi:hypothetical protein
MSKEKTYILVGDIKYPGRVTVKARSLNEAVIKAENKFDFEVYDKDTKNLAFEWNGDRDTIEEA